MSPSTSKDRYFEASRLEPIDPARALATYRELSATPNPWAANALFAEGRLELELGRKEDGRRTLEAYLRQYPDGPNAEDARHLLARLR